MRRRQKNIPAVRKAVLPAAGLGTRFLPATKAQPKEMLPLVDKPLIQYAVEEVVRSGIKNICIITGRGKAAIEDHFDVSFELEHLLRARHQEDLLAIVQQISELLNVTYIRQREALGLGHAVWKAKDEIGDNPFAVVLSDDIIYSQVPCLRQLLRVYKRYGHPVVALMSVPRESISAYGAVDAKLLSPPGAAPAIYRIVDLVEKPRPEDAPSNMAIIGRYILTPQIFKCLELLKPEPGGEIQLTDGLRGLLKRRRIYGVCFEGVRYDAGDKLGFLKATVEFALRRKDLGGPFREYLRRLCGTWQ
jgi:UTP--glucose-1-phosphate uridylyltransferase